MNARAYSRTSVHEVLIQDTSPTYFMKQHQGEAGSDVPCGSTRLLPERRPISSGGRLGTLFMGNGLALRTLLVDEATDTVN